MPRPRVPAPEMPVLLKVRVPAATVMVPVKVLSPVRISSPVPALTRCVTPVEAVWSLIGALMVRPPVLYWWMTTSPEEFVPTRRPPVPLMV